MRAGIERPADKAWIVLRDTHDGRHSASLRRGQALQQHIVAAKAVLLVDGEAVPPRLPDQLDKKGRVEGEPGVEQGAAFFGRLAKAVLAHRPLQALASASIWRTASTIISPMIRRI